MSSTTTKTVVTTTKKPNTTKRSARNRNRRKRKQIQAKQAKTVVANDLRLISKCVREYARAIVNPFGTQGVMPCIPDLVTIPSMKLQTKARGVFSTGTSGVGFITLNPWLMVRSNGGILPTSHSFPITFTGSNFALANYTNEVTGGVFATGVHTANSNSMINDAFIADDNRQVRLVAAGLKATYSGSNFRNQGRVILCRDQGNTHFDEGATANSLLNNNYNQVLPVSRKSEYVYYVPDQYDLNGYTTFQNNYDPNDDAIDRRCLMIYIDGGDEETPQSWLFEAVAYFEIIGPQLTLSKSHSDVEGLGHFMESLPVIAPTTVPKVIEESVLQRMIKLAKAKLKEYGPAAAGYAANFLLDRYTGSGRTPMITIEDID